MERASVLVIRLIFLFAAELIPNTNLYFERTPGTNITRSRHPYNPSHATDAL